MGFELLHAVNRLARPSLIQSVDFLEIENEFEAHFRKNLEITTAKIPTCWIDAGYFVLRNDEFYGRYDLIIANPPYFQKNEGSLSENVMSNRARFFIDDSFESMLKGFRNALAPGGRAYFLMKSGKKHGRDAFTSARLELFDFQVERLADVRGTDLIKCAR